MRSAARLIVTGLVIGLSATAAFTQTVIPAPPLDSEGARATAGFPDPYLWHVTGLPPGKELPVLSGAGPGFRIINALPEGTPIDMQNCMESRGGYWCRIATFDRPRISGWVDGRFLVKNGGDPPGTIGGVPIDPVIELPFGKGKGKGRNAHDSGSDSGWRSNSASDIPDNGASDDQ